MSAIELRAGQVLGRYELLMPIAKGGMAQIWAARMRGTRGFQKLVAMKTILAGTMDDTSLEQMFLEEASLASQIHHPNVVEILELGEQEGTLYLAMEWAEGEPLQVILRQSSERSLIPLPIAINLVGQACKGLHAAHELRDENGVPMGLVHRDISPHNILVTYSGTVKLVDFGIAKAMNKNSGLTETGQVKGKCAYMAPEQMRREPVDRRGDIFGMGIVLYQLTTGRHPFRGDDPAQTIQNIISHKPTMLPSKLIRDYPPKLELVVLKALKKDPAQRWATAHEMLEALQHAMPGCLEASFESNVQQFLHGLFSERAAKRRALLKAAQEQLDRNALEMGHGTGSSPRAAFAPLPNAVAGLGTSPGMGIGNTGVTGGGTGSGSGSGMIGAATGSNSSQQQSSFTQLGAEVPVRPKLLVSLAGLGTVLGAIAVIIAVAQPFGRKEPAPEPEPAARPPAPVVVAAPAPAPPPQQQVNPVVAAPVPEEPEADEDSKDPRDNSKKSRRTRTWAAGAPVPAAQPPAATPQAAAPAPAPAPAAPPAPAPAKPAASKNAWDPNAFGSRQ